MQFLIIGRDGTDDAAMSRRLAVRDAHIALGEKLRVAGNMWYGAALLNDHHQMIGSMLLMDFKDDRELRDWLDIEPYMTGKVWEQVEVQKCNVRDPWQFNRPQAWFEQRKSH